MKRRLEGFTIIEVVLVLAVVVIVVGVGFLAYANFAANSRQEVSQGSMDTHDMAMPSISTAEDLDKASDALDDTSFDNDGQAEIDKESANF